MSATATAREWITGWTLETPPRIDCSFIDASGEWEQGRWAGTQAYDLGLGAAMRCAWRPACATMSRLHA